MIGDYLSLLMPTQIQLNHFNFSLGTHETVDYQQQFTGTLHIGPKVDNFAAKKLKEAHSFVAQGMFDPEDADVAGADITVFDTENTGITGSGLGDI